MRKIAASLLFFLIAASGFLQALEKDRILFLLNSGNLQAALDFYREEYKIAGSHDYELIRKIGLALLDEGFSTNDSEIQLLSLFGAGVAMDDRAEHILIQAIKSGNPQFQLVAMNFLSKLSSDRGIESLNGTLNSPYLPIRLEAVYHLATHHHPKAFGHIEALMHKVPPEALPIFPQLLVLSGDKNSVVTLQKLLSHPMDSVRTEAILAVANSGRDDLLPDIRRLSTHLKTPQQETCAYALGIFKDEASAERLQQLAASPTDSVRLAALQALYRLGREEPRLEVEKMAQKGNLFAIAMLGGMHGSEQTLVELIRSKNLQIRINAGLALLELHHPQALSILPEILIHDARDLAFTKTSTVGKGLSACKAIPSATQNLADNPLALEVSLHLKEEALTQAMKLPENYFLSLAHVILRSHQSDLIPLTTQLLVNLQSPQAIELLKTHRNQPGAPLVRNYCNLALYLLKEPGPYRDNLFEWVSSYQRHDLIQFRPYIPIELRVSNNKKYELTPLEKSKLLIESFESLVINKDEETIDMLLKAIQYGNRKNRYVLAGLLVKAAH